MRSVRRLHQDCRPVIRGFRHEFISALHELEDADRAGDDDAAAAASSHLCEVCIAFALSLTLAAGSGDPEVARQARQDMLSVILVLGIFTAREGGANLDPERSPRELLVEVLGAFAAARAADPDPDSAEFVEEASRVALDGAAAAVETNASGAIDRVAPWLPARVVYALRAEHGIVRRGDRAAVVSRTTQRSRHAPRKRSSRRCARRGPPARAREDDPEPPADEGPS